MCEIKIKPIPITQCQIFDEQGYPVCAAPFKVMSAEEFKKLYPDRKYDLMKRCQPELNEFLRNWE